MKNPSNYLLCTDTLPLCSGFSKFFTTIHLAFEVGSHHYASSNGSFTELEPLFSTHYTNNITTKWPPSTDSVHHTACEFNNAYLVA